MYFITTKRMLEVCFSAHPNIQYRTFYLFWEKGGKLAHNGFGLHMILVRENWKRESRCRTLNT